VAGEVLKVVEGGDTGRTIEIGDEVTLGRDVAGAGQLAADLTISRRHARLRRRGDGRMTIEDLDSQSGTLVNGRRFGGQFALSDGDRVTIGVTTLVFVAAPEPEPQAATPAAAAPARRPPSRHQTATLAPAAAAPPPPGSGGPLGQPPPAAPPPPIGSPASAPARGRGRSGLVALVIVLVLALVAGGIYLIAHNRTTTAAPPPTTTVVAPAFDGTVYVESNNPVANSILALRYRNGSLRPLAIAEYPTGGLGSQDLTDSGVLDADQQLLLNPAGTLLFAVNQGSDTIAVFHVAPDGTLSPVAGSPFPSGGSAPASVGIDGDTIIVVNKAHDGIRDLTTVSPNYITLSLGADGRLTPLGRAMPIPPGSNPTQALTTPEHVIVSTEEGGPLRAFRLNGPNLVAGPNSPLPADPTLFPPGFPEDKKWELGVARHPTRPIVYANASTVSKLAIYTYDNAGALSFTGSVLNQGSVLPCWVVISADGRRLYTANAGNRTVSVFDIGTNPLAPTQIQTLTVASGGNPWNFAIDSSGRYLFLVVPRAQLTVAPGLGNDLEILSIQPDGTLVEKEPPVPLPVAVNTNPIGVAVSGRTG
jgi:DNA-binding beta-propeller fold protein YncE